MISNARRHLPLFTKKAWLVMFLMTLQLSVFAQLSEIRALQKHLPVAKDSLDYVRTLNRIGLLIHLKNADSSFYYGIMANPIADRLGFLKEKGDALANIAIGLTLKGLYSQSLTYYSRAYAEYQKSHAKPEIAQMLMNSSITYSFIGDSVKTRAFARRAINYTLKELKNDSAAGMLYPNYVVNSDLPKDSMTYYLREGERVATHFKDQRAILFISQIRADIFLEAGQPDKALPLIMDNRKISVDNNWDYHEMESINLLGTYYLAKNQPDSALKAYQQIYRMATANHYVYWEIDVLKAILKCYQIKKDVPGQLSTNQLLVTALEKDHNNDQSFLGDYLQYNNAQEDLRKLHLTNQSNHRRIIWLVTICLTVSFVLLLLVLLYKRTRKQGAILRENDVFKGRLLSMLAHDFRSPLNSTVSLVQLLRDHDVEDPRELESMYQLIEKDIREVLLTFDNILQWTRKQLSGYTYTPENVELKDSMDEAYQFFAAMATAKQLSLVNDIPATLSAGTDKEIIRFINRNLVHNAVKYSPKGGVITATCNKTATQLIVTVADDGPGLSKKQMQQLFSAKDHTDTGSNAQGAGLALTICSEFIGKLGGRIWAENKPGGGSRFSYALPIQQ